MGRTTGIALAGGRSSRMGTDKRLLSVGSKSLVQAAADKLAGACDEVVVVTDGEPVELGLPASVRVVGDLAKDLGPMMGILTGLSRPGTEAGLVLACDLPFVPVEFLAYLRDAGGLADIVIPQRGGRLEPLVGIYRASCVSTLQEYVAAGRLSLRCYIRDCGLMVHRISEAEIAGFGDPAAIFHNVNTAGELATARQRARRRQQA